MKVSVLEPEQQWNKRQEKAFYAIQSHSHLNRDTLYRHSFCYHGSYCVIADIDAVKQEDSEVEMRLGVRERRRGRKERRSTGLVQPDAEVAHSITTWTRSVFGFHCDRRQQCDRFRFCLRASVLRTEPRGRFTASCLSACETHRTWSVLLPWLPLPVALLRCWQKCHHAQAADDMSNWRILAAFSSLCLQRCRCAQCVSAVWSSHITVVKVLQKTDCSCIPSFAFGWITSKINLNLSSCSSTKRWGQIKSNVSCGGDVGAWLSLWNHLYRMKMKLRMFQAVTHMATTFPSEFSCVVTSLGLKF